jgi:hypothetical protein
MKRSSPLVCFVALSIGALCMGSCTKAMFQASIDGGNLRYKDKVVDEYDATKYMAATNLGMMAMMKVFGGDVTGGTSFNYEPDASLWASDTDPETLILQGTQADRDELLPPQKKPMPAFTENMYIYTGIQYIGRGSKEGLSRTRLHYLDIPVILMYESDMGTGQVFGGLGPYFAYGIGGKQRIDFGGSVVKSDAFGEDAHKRFDAGLCLTAGYRLPNELSIRIGYDIGMVNIARESSEFKEWVRTISLNVAYPIEKIKEELGIE